jgi:transposase
MRTAKPLRLRRTDRKRLEELVARPNARAGHVRRAWVVLLSADGMRGTEIAERLHLTAPQVCRIRSRYERGGVDGLADQPKSGRGNNVPEEQVRLVIATVMGPPPTGHSHWSTRTLAKVVGLGHTAVHDILRANDLRPHLQRTFKISRDPEFIEKVQDIVGLYLAPPRRAFVVCMDEKTQVQALERTQRMLPLRAGKIESRTHDYRRHGVVDLYAALELRTGKVVGDCRESHTARDFLSFLKQLDREFPRKALHVVLDNSSTHKTPEVWEWLAKHPRIKFHFTPKSASWMNQVEGFFSILTRRSIRRADFPSKAALVRHIETFLASWNENPRPFVWTKSAKTLIRDHRKLLALTSRTKH